MGDSHTIIFTDLDGTLIDFETYSPEIAAPLAQKIVGNGVPLVFCSSKTLEEQFHLMHEIGISALSIVENGSGIYLPASSRLLSTHPSTPISGKGRLIGLGVSSSEIQSEIRRLSLEMGIDFRPYFDLTVEAVARITGLSEDSADRARKRAFSETLTATLSDSIWNEVNSRLNQVGLQCLCGGRFYTVSSKDCNKGKAMRILVEAYKSLNGEEWRSIGIGDSANDYDMLVTADQGYLVQKPDGSWNEMDIPGLIRIPEIGPHGWVHAVNDALCLIR